MEIILNIEVFHDIADQVLNLSNLRYVQHLREQEGLDLCCPRDEIFETEEESLWV